MSIPHHGEVSQLVDLLVELRRLGVSEFASGDLRIVFALPQVSPASSVPFVSTAPQPSTPEHSGNTDVTAEKEPEMFNIYDVSPGRPVPGAPTADGLPVDPSTS